MATVNSLWIALAWSNTYRSKCLSMWTSHLMLFLSARTEGSSPAWKHVTRSKGPHVFGAFRRARSWKAETRRKRRKVEPWKRLSSARQLICFPPTPHLWFHITFLLCFEHGENIIQIILLGGKKNLIITASNEKTDTGEKCEGIVIFHILIHITGKPKRNTGCISDWFGAFCPGPRGARWY